MGRHNSPGGDSLEGLTVIQQYQTVRWLVGSGDVRTGSIVDFIPAGTSIREKFGKYYVDHPTNRPKPKDTTDDHRYLIWSDGIYFTQRTANIHINNPMAIRVPYELFYQDRVSRSKRKKRESEDDSRKSGDEKSS